MNIIPAMDIMAGRIVRLRAGEFSQPTFYPLFPVEAAQEFEAAGATQLHLVDLDGARSGTPKALEILKAITANTKLKVDFSGGLRRREDILRAFSAGASQVVIGTAAAQNPTAFSSWCEEFGPERLVLAADQRDGKVTIRGWQESTQYETSHFIKRLLGAGLQYVMVTDAGRDGLMAGPALATYAELTARFPQLKLIASGGIRDLNDLAALREGGVWGAIVGKALYEGRIALKSALNYSTPARAAC